MSKSVRVTLVADVTKFKKAFGRLTEEAGIPRLKQNLLSIAKAGAVAGTAIGAIALKAISMGSKLEQSAGAVKDVFKQYAGQVENLSTKAATAVGLSANSYNELAVLIGTQLKNAGVPVDQLAGKTDNLIKVGADLSAMFGGTAKEAVEAISSALKGERDPIERYGVSLRQASIDAEAARLGFTKVGGSFNQEAQAAATLSLIMKQTSDAHGKFGRENDTLAHKMQVAKAQLENFGAKMGTALLPAATAVIGALSTGLSPTLESIANWTQHNLAPAMERFGNYLKTDVMPVLKDLAATFVNDILPILKDLAIFIITNVIPAIVDLAKFIGEWKNVLLPMAGIIASIVLPLMGAYKAIKLYNSALTTIKAGQKAYSTAMELISKDTGSVKSALSGMKSAISGAAATAKTGAKHLLELSKAALASAASATKAGAAWLAQKAKIIATTAVTIAQKVATATMTVAQWALNAALTANPIGIVIAAIAALVGALIYLYRNNETVRKAIQDAWAGIKDAVYTARDYIKWAFNSMSDAGYSLMNWFTNLPRRIYNAIASLGSWIYGAGQDLVWGFINGIGSMGNALWNAACNLANKAIQAVKSWLGIASPSKVFASLGKNVGEGFSNGILAMSGEVTKAATSLADAAIIDPPTMRLPDLDYPTYQARPATTSTVYNVNVSAMRADADTGRFIAKALNDYRELGGR